MKDLREIWLSNWLYLASAITIYDYPHRQARRPRGDAAISVGVLPRESHPYTSLLYGSKAGASPDNWTLLGDFHAKYHTPVTRILTEGVIDITRHDCSLQERAIFR